MRTLLPVPLARPELSLPMTETVLPLPTARPLLSLPVTRTVLPTHFKLPPEGVDLEDVERQLVVQALERANNNQTRAAELLGLNRDQVRYRMEKFGLRQA